MKNHPRTVRRVAVAALLLAVVLAAWPAAAQPAAKDARAGKAAKGPGGPARWEETIRKFEAADAAEPPPKGAVLLVGGSNARRWTNVADYFPKHRVINRGFGGAQLADVLHFTDRIVLPYAPATIVLNAGGNDLAAGRSPGEIRDAARAFITKVRAALPGARILCIGLPPVRRASETPGGLDGLRGLNGLFADLARSEKNVEFVDLFPAFLDGQGRHRAELFVEDGTHFNPKGYETLAALLRERL